MGTTELVQFFNKPCSRNTKPKVIAVPIGHTRTYEAAVIPLVREERILIPRPLPDFISQLCRFSPLLRDKIWEWPGNEAREERTLKVIVLICKCPPKELLKSFKTAVPYLCVCWCFGQTSTGPPPPTAYTHTHTAELSALRWKLH